MPALSTERPLLSCRCALMECLAHWPCRIIKAQNPDVIVVVDNCYGEFTDVCEPPAVSPVNL